MIELVFFDVGGTLIAPHPSVGAVYARAGRAFGLTTRPARLEEAFSRAWKSTPVLATSDDPAQNRLEWRRIVERVFEDVAFTGERDACFDAMYDAFTKPDAWRIFDDVEETLRGLNVRGVRMGILSNWDHRLRPLFASLGFSDRFDPVVISSEVRLSKPDVAIYRRAIAMAGVSAERILHIGDHRALDVDPARAAGMSALLIDRKRASRAETIADLRQALEYIDRVNHPAR